jgi:hypothetical protein
MWFDNEVSIAAAACVFIIQNKKRFWVGSTLLARKQYSGNNLMIDLQYDDVYLTGELRYIIALFHNNFYKGACPGFL